MPIDYTTGDMSYSGVTQPSQLGHTPLDPSSSRAQLGTVVSQEDVQYSGVVPDDPRNHEQAYTWPTEGVSIQMRGIEVKNVVESIFGAYQSYNHLLEIFLVDGDKLYDTGGGEKRNLVSEITSGNQLRYFSTNTFNRENFMVHREVYRGAYELDRTHGSDRFLVGPPMPDYPKNYVRPLYVSDEIFNDVPRRRGSRSATGLYDGYWMNPEYPRVESGFIVNIPFPDMHLRVSQTPLINSENNDATYGSPALDHDGVNCGFNPREVFGETVEEFSNEIKGPGQYLFIIRLGGDDPDSKRTDAPYVVTDATKKRRDRVYYRCAFPKRLFHALIGHPEYAGGMARLMYGNWVPNQDGVRDAYTIDQTYKTAVPGIYPVDATTPTGYTEEPINPLDVVNNYGQRWHWYTELSPDAPYGDYYNEKYGGDDNDWQNAPKGFLQQYINTGTSDNFTGDPIGVMFPGSEFEQTYYRTDEWYDTAGGSTTGLGRDVAAWDLSTFEIAVTGPNDRAFRPWDAYPKNPETDEDSQEYSYVPMITPAQGIHGGQPIHQSFQQNLNPQKTVDYLTGIGTSRPQETVDVEAIAEIAPIEGPTGNDLPIYAGPTTSQEGTFDQQFTTVSHNFFPIFASTITDGVDDEVSDLGRASALHFCLEQPVGGAFEGAFYTGFREDASVPGDTYLEENGWMADPVHRYHVYDSGTWVEEDLGFGGDTIRPWAVIACTLDTIYFPETDTVGQLNANAICASTYGYNASHIAADASEIGVDTSVSRRTVIPYTGDVVSNVIIGDSIDPSPTRHVVTDDDNFGTSLPAKTAADFPDPLYMYATNPLLEENNDYNLLTLLADQDGVNTANQFCIDQGYIGADVNAAGSIIGSVAGSFSWPPVTYSYAVYYLDDEYSSDGWFNHFESDLGSGQSGMDPYNIAIWHGIECIVSATEPPITVSVWDGQAWEAPVWNGSEYYDSVAVWDRIVCLPHTETDPGAGQPIRGPEDIQDFTPTIDVYTGDEISLQRYWDSTVDPTEFQAATALNDIFVRVNLDDLDSSLEYTGLTYKFRVISWGDEENLSGLTDPEIDLQLYDGYDEISIREYPYEDVYWDDSDYVPPTTWIGMSWSGPSDLNEPIRGILSHAYREGGLKTIRGYVLSTMVDQRNPDYVQALRWKYFITKIYVSPPVYEVQDFGVLGGYDFTTLPFTDTRDAVAPIPTPIIGGLSDNSQYKKSINTLLKSGEFANQDQDEIVALEAAQSTDEMGQHIGKTDFQQMRLFGDGTYDLDRLIGPADEESIILTEKINNARDRDLKDKCLLELNPGELSAGSILDTSGRGNIGIMIGDYGLEKDSAADPLTKTSNMLVPEMGTQDKAL